MIKYGDGNILNAGTDAIVCPVNCQPGVLGAGLALQVATLWPEVRRHHIDAVRSNLLYPGRVAVSYGEGRPQVVLFPTKDHWRDPSQLEWVWEGLNDLVHLLRKRHSSPHLLRRIGSIAVPALGCGLGGLDRDLVRPMIEVASSVTPEVDWTYYSPQGPRHHPAAAHLDCAPGEPILVPDRRGGLRQLGVYDG